MGDVDAHVCDGGDSWISPDYTCWNWGSEVFLAGDNLLLHLAYNGNKMDGDKPMANGADACLKTLARRMTSKKQLKWSEVKWAFTLLDLIPVNSSWSYVVCQVTVNGQNHASCR